MCHELDADVEAAHRVRKRAQVAREVLAHGEDVRLRRVRVPRREPLHVRSEQKRVHVRRLEPRAFDHTPPLRLAETDDCARRAKRRCEQSAARARAAVVDHVQTVVDDNHT